ncbi:uncharacterized protein CBL_20481 [Carabus blaptoides fortunei]
MSRLIVKNLPKSITEEKLRTLFSPKGEITDIQLKYTPDGKFRQFGFIGYRTVEQAEEAIDFFNNTCINTSKISVEKCVNLGDASKVQSWSKYASDSTAYKKKHADVEENKQSEVEDEPKEEKNIKIKEFIQKYKDDPMFEEFMQLHGTKDINTLLGKLEQRDKTVSQEKKDEEPAGTEDSGNESTEENADKVANTKISDLEYMKLLMEKSLKAKSEPRKRTEKQPKAKIKLYTVKLRGLPYTCKKKDIKQFFSPLVPYTIRVPPKVKGIAYVGFKAEKHMHQALNKDKSFIGAKRICVFEYTTSETLQNNNEDKDQNVKKGKWVTQEEALKNEEDIAESGRIFLRNLSYTTTEDDVQQLFSKFGPITEISMPVDKNTRKLKGFGVVTFLMPEHAVKAYSELDGSVMHGRMLHLLPGKAKDVPDELNNMDGLSYKQKKALKDKAQAGSSHNWNSLFMGHNAIAEVISDTYGTSKETVLDGRGKGSAAVRLALGETQIVAQTRQFLENSGVLLDAFNQAVTQRSKTIILVKNLPAQTQPGEIQKLFAPHGLVGRVVLPPSGVTALVEFMEPSEAKKAFMKLAYSKFKNGPLYLEWAPENTFKTPADKTSAKSIDNIPMKTELPVTEEIKTDESVNKEESDEDEEAEPDTTLFVKNLCFTTTEEMLRKHFQTCGKLNYVSVATKKDPQNPGKKLSMGYGFVRYQYKVDANKALKTLQQSTLEGKSLELKRSERTLQNEVKTAKKKTNITKQTGTKILVKNIPFQANKNEVNELFKAFGEISALRLPKKLTLGAEAHRGFAFVDYVTKTDAKRAFEALSQSTHLYGRRLVLEWASKEEGVEEIRKRTAKHFHPTEEVRSKKSALDAESFVNS